MDHPRLHKEFLVHLKAGQEPVASKHFYLIDEAAEWAAKTTRRIRRALEVDIFAQVAKNIVLEVECIVFAENYRSVSKVWCGSLGDVDTALNGAVRKFAVTMLGDELKKAELALQVGDGTRLRRSLVLAGVLALGVVLAFIGLRAMPPIFDTEVLSARILSVPPDFLAGTWGATGRQDDCERARLNFTRGRMEMSMPTGIVSYTATYEVTGPNAVKISLVAGTSKFAKHLRVDAAQSTFTVQRVDLPEGASKAQVALAAGARFFKCV
jgi:hypothetical protein